MPSIPGLFSTFNHAVRALQYAQYGVNVHGTNIAHANDPNYTRREMLTYEDSKVKGPAIVRFRDRFIDDQYRLAAGGFGEAEVRRSIMGKVEDIFGDPVGGGLRKAIDQFFDTWQGLAENPSDGVARIELLSAAGQFAHEVRTAHQKLSSLEQSVNEELSTRVLEVNTEIDRIFDLNKKVSDLSRHGLDDAGLRDQRDVALDRLAKLTGAYSVEDPDGTIRVVVGSTVVLDGPTVVKLTLVPAADGPQPTWEGYPDPTYKGRGAIAGLLSTRDVELKELKQDIDRLGRTVATKVNDQQALGYPVGGGTPKPFFNLSLAPADIVVNPDLAPADIAAAGNSLGLPADGDNARKIAALGESPIFTSIIIPSQTQAARSYYRNLVGWIGNRAAEAANQQEFAQVHMDATNQERQSQWGVSLDEEVANLSVQQKAFAAASRIITVMDEMIADLIQRVGR